MITVVRNLSDEDKKKLVRKVQELVGSGGVAELVRFVGSQVQRDALLHLIQNVVNETKGG